MNKNLINVLFGFFTAMLINGPVFANEAEPTDAFPVTVDLIMDEVSDISISRGQFRAVAEVLLSWTGNKVELVGGSESRTLMGEAIDSYLTENFDPAIFIANAEGPREVMARSLTLFPDGRAELFEKFAVQLTFETAIPSYPFGNLDLHLELQSANHPLPGLVFEPRHYRFGHEEIAHEVVKGNWYLEGSRSEVESVKSLSHGGESRFSIAVYHVKVSHDFVDVAQKILIPLLSILLLSMFINRFSVIYETEDGGDNANWRVGGQMTLLLTLFALKFALGEDIPATHYLTMIDALFVAVGIMVVFALVWGIYVIHVFQSGRVDLGNKLEHKSNAVFMALGFVFMVWVSGFVLLN